jgi:ArsR family transcriptional regulator, arsenate/arsenite/antimonite-responsive transcriptional repressor / arsenate reductase (thioredoxin)
METKHAASGFAALSQETRINLVRLLAGKAPAGIAAGDIAAALGQAPSTLSFHLSALEQAGLIASARQGRQVIYSVRLAGLRDLFGFLTETCCNGRPDLCADLARLLPDDVERVRVMTPAFNVLFLCTHNSARSILAEAILRKVGHGKFNAYSAGSEPGRQPMPEVIARLSTLGHDVTTLRCKSWNEFMRPDAPRMDFVITLCDTLTGQICPDFGDRPVTAGWPFPDPAKFTGSEAERATLLNELYGMIRRRLENFVNLPFASLDRMALKVRLDELADSTRPYLVRT